MKIRQAWKIVRAGSGGNHREGTKIRARKRALCRYSTNLFTAAEFADMVASANLWSEWFRASRKVLNRREVP